MNKKHLFWIIPITFIIAFLLGELMVSIGTADVLLNHPVVYCIFNGEDKLNIDTNILPFTPESQREILSQRCMRQYYNSSADYDNVLVEVK